jgi:hypothetical protein
MRSILILFCFVFGLHLSAQDFYTKEIIETSVFESAKVTALKYDLQIVDKPAFQKLWKKEMSKYSKGDFETSEFQTKMTDVVIPAISKESFTTFINAKTIEGGLELIFALKDSVQFVDLNTSPYKKDIEAYFESFILAAYVNKLNEKLKTEMSNLDAIDNEIKKNYKEIAKNDKLILKLETEIENTNRQIDGHDAQYKALLTAIESSKTELAGTSKDNENYKVVKKEVKNLEKNKKTMESDLLSNKELVYDDEAKIAATKEAIASLEASIANLEERKIAQKQVILDLEEEIYSLSKP